MNKIKTNIDDSKITYSTSLDFNKNTTISYKDIEYIADIFIGKDKEFKDYFYISFETDAGNFKYNSISSITSPETIFKNKIKRIVLSVYKQDYKSEQYINISLHLSQRYIGFSIDTTDENLAIAVTEKISTYLNSNMLLKNKLVNFFKAISIPCCLLLLALPLTYDFLISIGLRYRHVLLLTLVPFMIFIISQISKNTFEFSIKNNKFLEIYKNNLILQHLITVLLTVCFTAIIEQIMKNFSLFK